ncbi:MAG: alpha/beta hydrolase [bacterium]|nr:alpha/beta hydrolase [bacterium]
MTTEAAVACGSASTFEIQQVPRGHDSQGDPVVVLLHGSAGAGAMWQSFEQHFCEGALAPDLIGYGSAPGWEGSDSFTLRTEVSRLADVLPAANVPLHLVGYSYGGAVAVEMALTDLWPIKSLTLIEPVLFAALRYAGAHRALDRFGEVRTQFVDRLERGDVTGALHGFIDFWTGAGAWEAMSDAAREQLVNQAAKIRLDWESSFAADPGRDALRRLAAKTLLVRGDNSPWPMMSLVDGLHEIMPSSAKRVVQGAGHLLPMTHPKQLAGLVCAHSCADPVRR